jgi:hypothetical protein
MILNSFFILKFFTYFILSYTKNFASSTRGQKGYAAAGPAPTSLCPVTTTTNQKTQNYFPQGVEGGRTLRRPDLLRPGCNCARDHNLRLPATPAKREHQISIF